MADPVAWYDANADAVVPVYEAAKPEDLHAWLLGLLPSAPAAILDVGAGSGRDAAWLAAKGYDVVAVEPSAGMRTVASRLRPEMPVRWISDSLPALSAITKSGMSFDLILLSAVWMHVAPGDRARAFRKVINLLNPGGLIAITLRHGPDGSDAERAIHPVSLAELETLVRNHGAFVERSIEAKDELGRSDVRWTQVAIRLPDISS
jgi:SAM-dependent methyltransferase